MARKSNVSIKRKLTYRLGTVGVQMALLLGRCLPLKTSDWLGVRLGRLGFYLNRKHRTRAISNLKMCFPEWTDAQVVETAKKVFAHFGKTAMRFFSTVKLTDEQVLASVVQFDDVAVREALSEGKGVLLVAGHFGNWERSAMLLTLRGFTLSAVARNANDARTTEIVNRGRARQGVEVLSRGNAAKEILRRLRRNQIVAILADQNTKDVMAPFFGFPAGTATGPAVFHLRTGAPIVFGAMWERHDGKYEGFCKRIEFTGLTGEPQHDEREIMTRLNHELEKIIRKWPEQWLWMHDRWKLAREQGLIDV